MTFLKSIPKNALSFLIFCDEAYFYLVPPINSQNDRMWLESKQSNKVERPLHDEKVLVCCAISCGQAYGPYFFQESVNQHNYLEMLRDFFWKRHCLVSNIQKYYFAQDFATPHTANIVQEYLKSKSNLGLSYHFNASLLKQLPKSASFKSDKVRGSM